MVNGVNGVASGLAKLRPAEKRPMSPQNGQPSAKRIKVCHFVDVAEKGFTSVKCSAIGFGCIANRNNTTSRSRASHAASLSLLL